MLGNVIHKVSQVIQPHHFEQSPEWKEALSNMTEMELLDEVKERLSSACTAKVKDLGKKIDFVLDMDESAYRTVQALVHNYLKSMSKNEELKRDVEESAQGYLRQLYAAYTMVIAEFQQNNKVDLTKGKLNLLLARYLNTAFMMAKWRYFDDQPAPLGMWSNVHKIIRIAEELSLMNKELFLYDFQNKETSLATLLKRGFMLDTLQKGSYTHIQIELTDRILKTWSTNPLITNRYTKQKEYQFFIHLDEDNRPQRIRGAKQHPDFRYWRTTDIVDLIEGYLCAVDTRKPLDSFNLLTMAGTEDLVSLFKKLRVEWCVQGYKRQRRDEDRVSSFNMLNVSHGISDIGDRIRFLQKAPNQKNSAFENNQLTLVTTDSSTPANQINTVSRENWVMLEESAGGFSVELGSDIASWIKTGSLIGYTSGEAAHSVALAEVRTVRKRANGTYRVGLSKVCQQTMVMKASRVQKGTPFSSVDGYIVNDGEENLSFSDEFPGLFIEGELQERPRMIVPRHQFKRASRYRVSINGSTHMVLAGEILNNHREWVCFEVIT